MTSPLSTSSSGKISTKTEESALPPLLFLPLETKNEILRFCDQATLAKTSLVNLAFLQLSSRLLYRDVEIPGFESLGKLFCARDDNTHQRQLSPYLSLDQIENFTFTEDRPTFPTPPALYLDRSRFAAIALQRLAISLPSIYDGLATDGRTDVSAFISNSLLPLFLPSEIFINGIFPRKLGIPKEADLNENEHEHELGTMSPSPGPAVVVFPPFALPVTSVHLKNAIIVNIKHCPLRRLVVEVSDSLWPASHSRVMMNNITNLACSNYPLEGITGEAGLELWMGSEEKRDEVMGMIKERLEGRFGVEGAKERLGRVQVVFRQS